MATTDERLEEFTNKLLDLGEKLVDAAEPAGKAAWEVTMAAIQLEAVFTIGVGLVFLAIAIVCGRLLAKNIRGASAASYDDEGPYVVGSFIFGAATLLTSIAAAAHLTKASHWIAAVSPEASLALRIMN